VKPTPAKLTASDLSDYLDGFDLTPPAPNPLHASYQEAAAVLAAIRDPSALRATSGEVGEAENVLGPDLVTTSASRQLGGSVMLRHQVRREALLRLGTTEAMLKALDANPAERAGPVQARFEQYLRGEALPLDEQSVQELDETLQAVLWLEDLNLLGVPTADQVRTTLAKARFIQPFERLAGKHFRGRVPELDKLRAFVGILEPETRTEQIKGTFSRLLRLTPKPALNLFGSGGMGKSALVMRFFLEHVRLSGPRKVPFAYLDFDSPFLNINDLSTLEAEIFRQLSLQFDSVRRPTVPASPRGTARVLANLFQQLSHAADQPFLLVLDTFEEVQYGGEARAYPLWDMLNELQARWPFLRVLISGRAPVTSFKLAGQPPESMELTGLDAAAAEAILSDAGVKSRTLARTLVRQVGSVPLSLHLAAAVVKTEHVSATEGIQDLETSSYYVFSINDELIQGQLYERILGHIHDPQVVKLAHPGLVLRKITADLILHVLREPCDLSITTIDEARELLTQLAKETALVTEESSDSLSHRLDLRRTMLKLLIDEQPDKATRIHRLAVDYYTGREEEGAAAEALYHRLMLGELPRDRSRELQRRDVRVSLSRSLSELPRDAQILLAELGYEIAPDVLKQASQAQHEGFLAAKVVEHLPRGPSALSSAAALISATAYRGHNSPLYLEDARVCFLQGRYGETVSLLDEGLRYAIADQDRVRTLDLLALQAWVLEDLKRLDLLGRALPRFHQRVERASPPRPLLEIQAAAQLLRAAHRLGRTEESRMRAEALASRLLRVDWTDFMQVAMVLYDVFVHIVEVDPECVRRVSEWAFRIRGNRPHVVSAEGSLLNPPPQAKPRELAARLDGVLRAWPDRLPYIQPIPQA
jgi:hypothetical protein